MTCQRNVAMIFVNIEMIDIVIKVPGTFITRKWHPSLLKDAINSYSLKRDDYFAIKPLTIALYLLLCAGRAFS